MEKSAAVMLGINQRKQRIVLKKKKKQEILPRAQKCSLFQPWRKPFLFPFHHHHSYHLLSTNRRLCRLDEGLSSAGIRSGFCVQLLRARWVTIQSERPHERPRSLCLPQASVVPFRVIISLLDSLTCLCTKKMKIVRTAAIEHPPGPAV